MWHRRREPKNEAATAGVFSCPRVRMSGSASSYRARQKVTNFLTRGLKRYRRGTSPAALSEALRSLAIARDAVPLIEATFLGSAKCRTESVPLLGCLIAKRDVSIISQSTTIAVSLLWRIVRRLCRPSHDLKHHWRHSLAAASVLPRWHPVHGNAATLLSSPVAE